jgi:hypothetical protein
MVQMCVMTCILVLGLLLPLVSLQPVWAGSSTTSLHVVKYAEDGETVLDEETVTYEWMKENLPVQGDGKTHYYHQGPIFEGDMWDPGETLNLKDKGAVMGTALKDICDLVGGMSPGDEIALIAVDGWHTEFAYENIYEALPEQGPIALCWYNGEDALFGERYGEGYPGSDGYYTAMQIVFLAGTPNPDSKYVFGNSDMKICLPDEKYQHFYEGLASTNGLSGKWIREVAIFTGESPIVPGEALEPEGDLGSTSRFPLIPVILGSIGLVIIILAVIFIFVRKEHNEAGTQ